MDDHFNNVLNILKERPLALDFDSIGNIFRELADSANQDLLLDIITTTRSAEDRSLFCTYLLEFQRVMKQKEPRDTDFDQFMENFLIILNKKEPILKLIGIPYPENYEKTISKKLDGTFHAILNSAPDDIQPLLIEIFVKNRGCFSIRSLHAITFDLLGSLLENDGDKTKLLSEVRSVILMGRGLLTEDDYFKQSLVILNNNFQTLDEESIDEVISCFLASNQKIEIAEMISITRPFLDRLAIFKRLVDTLSDARENSIDTSQIESCLSLLLEEDVKLSGVMDDLKSKNKK